MFRPGPRFYGCDQRSVIRGIDCVFDDVFRGIHFLSTDHRIIHSSHRRNSRETRHCRNNQNLVLHILEILSVRIYFFGLGTLLPAIRISRLVGKLQFLGTCPQLDLTKGKTNRQTRNKKKRAASRLRAERKPYRLSTGCHGHHSWLCLFGSTHVELVRPVYGEQHRQ